MIFLLKLWADVAGVPEIFDVTNRILRVSPYIAAKPRPLPSPGEPGHKAVTLNYLAVTCEYLQLSWVSYSYTSSPAGPSTVQTVVPAIRDTAVGSNCRIGRYILKYCLDGTSVPLAVGSTIIVTCIIWYLPVTVQP